LVFSEEKGGAGDAGQGVEEPGVVGGIGIEFAVEIVRGDSPESLKDLSGGDLEDDVREFILIAGEKHFQGELLLSAEFIEPPVFALPVEEAASFPFGDVVLREVFPIRAKLFEDLGVRCSVFQHSI